MIIDSVSDLNQLASALTKAEVNAAVSPFKRLFVAKPPPMPNLSVEQRAFLARASDRLTYDPEGLWNGLEPVDGSSFARWFYQLIDARTRRAKPPDNPLFASLIVGVHRFKFAKNSDAKRDDPASWTPEKEGVRLYVTWKGTEYRCLFEGAPSQMTDLIRMIAHSGESSIAKIYGTDETGTLLSRWTRKRNTERGDFQPDDDSGFSPFDLDLFEQIEQVSDEEASPDESEKR